MSLAKTKRILNYDQQNIIVGEVVNDFDQYTTVRTYKGETVRAVKVLGYTYPQKTQVELRTDKRTYTILGPSKYAPFAAERYFAL